MFNFKKILSFILILIFAFNLISTSTIAYELKFYDDCSQINDDNLECCYSDCANVNTKDILNAGKSFVFIKSNFPKNDFYLSFKNLDEIFEKLKIKSTEELSKNTDRLYNEKNSYFTKLNTALRIGISSLIGAVLGFGISYLIPIYKHRRHLPSRHGGHRESHSNLEPVVVKPSVSTLSLIGAVVGGGISALYLAIKNNQMRRDYNEAYQKYSMTDDINEAKKAVLNLLLSELEESDYYSGGTTEDSIIITVSNGLFDPKPEFDFSSCKLGLNFTAGEKAILPKKLKDFAKKIRQNLEENEMLSEYNKEQARN